MLSPDFLFDLPLQEDKPLKNTSEESYHLHFKEVLID